MSFNWTGAINERFLIKKFWLFHKENILLHLLLKHTFCIQQVFAKLDGGHAARRFLDHISYVTDAVSSLGTPSSQAVTNWITDKIAPDYWVPNSEITVSKKKIGSVCS